MKRKLLVGIMGGILGFIFGAFGGGVVGLVIGGTLLGGFDIYENLSIEGYELAVYIGAALGAIFDTPLGILIALKVYSYFEESRSANRS